MTNNKTISNRANKLAKFVYREVKGLDELETGLLDEFFELYLSLDPKKFDRAFEISDILDALEAKKAKFEEIARLLKLLSVEIRNK